MPAFGLTIIREITKMLQKMLNVVAFYFVLHREVVVPILLEPIQKKYVTEQMVCLFATQTYIKWPQRNQRKQRQFWNSLINTLRPPKDQAQYDEDNSNFLTTEVNRIRPAVLQL